MSQKNIYLAAAPKEEAECASLGYKLAHLSYRVSPSGRLARANLTLPTRGGILVLRAGENENIQYLCRDIYAELTRRSFEGVLLDSRNGLSLEFVSALADGLRERETPLYVYPQYAKAAKDACVLISGEVSGGSYKRYLQEEKDRYGRIAVEITPMRMDFKLPSERAAGEKLSIEEFESLFERLAPMPFYSSELYAKYFTYMALDRKAHFVLYDDAYTVSAKIRDADAPVFLLYNECALFLKDLEV